MVKSARYTTFGNILYISTSHKLEINPILGSTNLWRLSREYELLNVLCWCKGPLSGSEDQKIGQNDQIYDFWVPLKYSKLPIKLAKIRVMTRNFKRSVLYLFWTTGKNFSLIGALEGTFLGGAASEGVHFLVHGYS